MPRRSRIGREYTNSPVQSLIRVFVTYSWMASDGLFEKYWL